VAADRRRNIEGKLEALSNIDQHSGTDNEKATIIKKNANIFGGTVKPNKTAVQKRREEFERKQKEAAEKSDHRAHIQVSWSKAGSTKFKKAAKDSRGVAPKRGILDLP